MRRPAAWLTAGLVAAAAFLPFARGMLRGESFYFRDLSRVYFPIRHFLVDGLLRGEARYWNPYVHEGHPLVAVYYPLDLLQLIVPDERGFTLLLALHGPLAAVAFLALARGLGLGLVAAAGGALVYSLGGFFLATLNLYAYFQTAAWAPLVILGLWRAADRGTGRSIVGATLLVALAASTTGLELFLQTLLIAGVLALSRRDTVRLVRAGAAAALGAGLAAYTLLPLSGLVAAGSARGEGLHTSVVLAHSIHPMTLVQVVVGNLYGDLGHLSDRWWGQNFFPSGFPYILSLYLGVTVLSLGATGAFFGRVFRKRLVLLALVAVIVCLGRYAHWDVLIQGFPALRMARFPTKAFFTVHLSIALLSALGLNALTSSRGRAAWRGLLGLTAVLGAALATAPVWFWSFEAIAVPFLDGFFPQGLQGPQRVMITRFVLGDAVSGGLVAIAVALVALVVLARYLSPGWGSTAIVGLIAADLLRTGAGLNPTVTPSFFKLSEPMQHEVAHMRRTGGRLFTCEPAFSPAYHQARQGLTRGHEVWTFATNLEVLSPFFNLPFGVPSALTRDLMMMVPESRVLSPAESSCASLGDLTERLRRAGVAHVLSLAPIDSPELKLRSIVRPRRVAPLALHLYELEGPLPLRSVARMIRPADTAEGAERLASQPGFQEAGGVAIEGVDHATTGAAGRVVSAHESPGHIELEVEATAPTAVVIRDAYAPGWTAQVNGEPARCLRADGRHRAVLIPEGVSRVVLRYRPPRLLAGLAITALCGVACCVLWIKGRRLTPAGDGEAKGSS